VIPRCFRAKGSLTQRLCPKFEDDQRRSGQREQDVLKDYRFSVVKCEIKWLLQRHSRLPM
jgi:hypothetical protein